MGKLLPLLAAFHLDLLSGNGFVNSVAYIVIIAIAVVLGILGAATGIVLGIVFGVKRAKKRKQNK